MKKIILLIPTYNAEKHIGRCLEHIQRSLKLSGEPEFRTDVLVIDDCSTDSTPSIVQQNNHRLVTGTGNLWWSGSINRGVKIACEENYDYALLMNSDNFVPEDYFQVLYRDLLLHPGAVVGSAVYDENGKPFFLGCLVNSWGQFEYIRTLEKPLTQCDVFGGMGVAVPVNVFRTIGVFDENKLPHYFGDTDFWIRCRKNKIELLISRDARIMVDAKSTGAKVKGNKLVFFLRNLRNRRFHANIIAVSNFYLNNYAWIGLPLYVSLFYVNYLLSSSKKVFQDPQH